MQFWKERQGFPASLLHVTDLHFSLSAEKTRFTGLCGLAGNICENIPLGHLHVSFDFRPSPLGVRQIFKTSCGRNGISFL